MHRAAVFVALLAFVLAMLALASAQDTGPASIGPRLTPPPEITPEITPTVSPSPSPGMGPDPRPLLRVWRPELDESEPAPKLVSFRKW
eukprot:tig00000310_g23989.t1